MSDSENFTLVMWFNAFTGKLEGGYLADVTNENMVGHAMTPTAICEYLTANPSVRCDPLKV